MSERLRSGAVVEQGSALSALLPREWVLAHTATEVLLCLGETGKVPGCVTLGLYGPRKRKLVSREGIHAPFGCHPYSSLAADLARRICSCDHGVCPCPCKKEVLLLHRAVPPVFMRQCLAMFSTQKYYFFRLIIHSPLNVG